MRYPGIALLQITLVVLAACQDDPRDAGQANHVAEHADSQVVHRTITTADTLKLRLSDRPVLEIAFSGDRASALYQVTGSLRLPTGTVVVADNGSHQLRYFDEHGKQVSSVGRSGQGPGEFARITWLGECLPETVFVYDSSLQRVSLFSATGKFVRSFQVSAADPHFVPQRVACNREGTLALLAQRGPDIAKSLGPYRTVARLDILNVNGEVVLTLGEFPGDERERMERSDAPRAFGKNTLHALTPNALYIATTDDQEIEVYDLHGQLKSVIGLPVSQRRISQDDVDSFIDERTSAIKNPDRRAFYRRQWKETLFPELHPAYSALHVDRTGRLWAGSLVRPKADSVVWLVLHEDGSVSKLSLPSRLHVFQIGPDFVLGRWTDSLGVESVRFYDLSSR